LRTHLRRAHEARSTSQNAWLTTLGPACVILVLVLHPTRGLAFAKGAHLGAYLDAGVLFFALLALAGRALESRLIPDDEIERYEPYQGDALRPRDAFDAARTLGQKVEAMNEMEFAGAEEFQEFLRVKSRARFVMAPRTTSAVVTGKGR
jgi:hypothetical protein